MGTKVKRETLIWTARQAVKTESLDYIAALTTQIENWQLAGKNTGFLEKERAAWEEIAQSVDLELKALTE